MPIATISSSLVHTNIHRILNDPTDQDAQRLAAVFDRLGQSLGLLKLSSAFAGGLRHALKTSARACKQRVFPGFVQRSPNGVVQANTSSVCVRRLD